MSWETLKLGDIIEIKKGKYITKKESKEGPYPVILGGQEPAYYIDTFNHTGKAIVVSRSGASAGYVSFWNEPIFVTDGFLIEPRNGVDIDFLYHLMKFHQPELQRKQGGAAIPHVNPRIINAIEVKLPPISIQRRIVDILSTYEDLIRNNTKQIKTLGQMAENLYKEWFVRFRFPGYENIGFENGIPKGWNISTVKETFEIFDTERIPLSSMDRDEMQKIYPYYGAAELMDYVDDYLFDGIYLLLGEDGSVITPKGKPVLQYVWGKFWVNNHAHVLQGKYPFSTEYLHLMFGQMDITGIVTGAAQPKISQGRLFRKKTILPTEDLVVSFNSIIQPIYQSVRELSEATNNLVKQRDLLLPRLMSGKLEV